MRVLVCALVIHSAWGGRLQPTDVWISTSGSDTSGTGSQASPWATPFRAARYVQEQRKQGGGKLPGSVSVHVEPGVYLLPESLVLDDQNTGDSASQVAFINDQRATPAVWSGGAALSPLPGPNGTVLFRIPDSVACDGRCRQLFRLHASPGVPSGRRNMSRTAMMLYDKITSSTIVAKEGQLAGLTAASLAAAEAVYYQSWTSGIGLVQGVSGNTLAFSNAIDPSCYGACGNRYFLRNLLDPARIAPGSFSVDPSNRTILYRPFPGELVHEGDFVVPNITSVVRTESSSGGSGPANVLFQGLTFAHSASALGSCLASGCRGQSASGGTVATVRLQNATGFTLRNCTVAHTGHYGVWVDVGSSAVSVSHCLLRDLGAGGVRIGQPIGGVAPSLALQTRDVEVADCVVRDTGRVVMAGAGVLSQQASDVSITHNDIGFTLYTGVSTGWTWDYEPTTVSNVSVTFNDIHDIFQGELSDGGCVYTLGKQPGGLVANNRCWNVHAFGYGGWGTYTDQASSFITFRDNLIHNTKSAGHHQHFGENNVITNNIIAFSGAWPCDGAGNCDSAGLRSSQHPSGLGSHSSFSFTRNIVLLNHTYSTPYFTTIPTGLNNDTLDSNTFWSTAVGADMPFGPTQHQVSFKDWQSQGKDVHSVVADPGFVDAQGLNFTLKPTSPALKLGFQPIDFSQNGPRPMHS